MTQNLALKVQLGATALQNFPKGISHDYSCPPTPNIMERRLCSKCGLYLESIKELFLHKQVQKKQNASPSDIPSEPPSKQSAEMVQPPRPCCILATKRTSVYVPIPGIKVEGT